MKAFHLAFAFLLASLPAVADELSPTSIALGATNPELAEPGSYHWTVADNPADEADASTAQTASGAFDQSAPARAALAQIRADMTRVMEEARRASAKVSRIRYDLHISCVMQPVSRDPDPLESVGMPWIWESMGEKDPQQDASLELCQIDYTQRIRTQSQADENEQAGAYSAQPQMQPYQISLPTSD